VNYFDNPIKGDYARIERSAKYYDRIANMLDNVLNVIEYTWAKKNESVAINALNRKADDIIHLIVYAKAYYGDIDTMLREYNKILRHYSIVAQQYVDEHNALVRRRRWLETDQPHVRLGMMDAMKTEPEMRLERVVREFENETNKIVNKFENYANIWIDNGGMRDSFFENVLDVITDVLGFSSAR
jgi:hypothetical protein